MKEKCNSYRKFLLPGLVFLILGLMLSYLILDMTVIVGTSMEPTYHTGNIIFRSKMSNSNLSRGTVVKFSSPDINNSFLVNKSIKRIVGIPGDELTFVGYKLYINGEFLDGGGFVWADKMRQLSSVKKSSKYWNREFKVILRNNEYFVMGDNFYNSIDSRNYGPIEKSYIVSVVGK